METILDLCEWEGGVFDTITIMPGYTIKECCNKCFEVKYVYKDGKVIEKNKCKCDCEVRNEEL